MSMSEDLCVLTSAADTKESVEAMLMVSFRQESSKSSRPEISVCLSGKVTENGLQLKTCMHQRTCELVLTVSQPSHVSHQVTSSPVVFKQD